MPRISLPPRDYPHLEFRRCWTLTPKSLLNLGRCETYIKCFGELPIDPTVQTELRKVSFERGAQATTAIEGNTLTEVELREMLAGKKLPESRAYQAQEVRNALDLMNQLWKDVVLDGKRQLLSVATICEFNRQVGKDLGPLYDGAPGKLRGDRRHVGRYLAPPPEYVEPLMDAYCSWLRDEFHFEPDRQSIQDAIVQAVVAHVFFEWIHPFADGNGRTGRMIEFYVLLRAGMPDISAHVLANHYNNSRSEYAAHFENARQKRDLTDFLDYAIQGLVDGLEKIWDKVHSHTFRVCWEAHVYRVFANYSDYHKRSIFKRRRQLALSMPIDKDFTLLEIARSSDLLAKEYLGKDHRCLKADFDKIIELQLAEASPIGAEGLYRATSDRLRANQIVPRARRHMPE
jgi:Fic family protein